jgi:uncharacterized repeat protein (TIGR04076 family)
MSFFEVTVNSQRGKCVFVHKVGDKILLGGRCIHGDICYSVLTVLFPDFCDEIWR